MPPAQMSPQQIALAFLKYARTYPGIVQVGSVASGVSGGASSRVTWTSDVPEAPSWCEAIVLQISLPITLTLPAGATANVSPWFPFPAFAHNLILGGAPPFAQPISGVPFWLDEITSRDRYDTSDNDPTDIPAAWRDTGPSADTFSLNGITPGGTVVNSGTAVTNTNYTIVFRVRIRLGRSWHNRVNPNLYGMVPLGDPMNRPRLDMYLNALVGPNPEDNLFQDVSAAGITCVTNGSPSITAVWESKSLDILPAGVVVPSPLVGMGLTVNSTPQAIQNAGQIQQIQHRSAMIYEKIIHLLVNDQQYVDPDYFGLWITGESQSARWDYDSNQSNWWKYYDDTHRKYARYLPDGMVIANLIGGEDPANPSATPYDGLMSPDVTYAAIAGIAATPAMYTAVRVPSGTSMNGAYVRTYSFGLVTVPY